MARTFTANAPYFYTGITYAWEVPPHVPGSLRFQIAGGGGGGQSAAVGGTGRAGGRGNVSAAADLAPGTIVTIALGGHGEVAPAAFNGGVNPWSSSYNGGRGSAGGGGGGAATVVAIGGTPIAVAGGGGGGTTGPYASGRNGYSGGVGVGSGNGGGGQSNFSGGSGSGGTLVGPGAGGLAPTGGGGAAGFPGVGSTGGASANTASGGGGGGGYYGAGGGAAPAGGSQGVGGGGSTWVDPAIFSDAASIFNEQGLTGNTTSPAYVTITWRGIDGPNLGDCYAVNRTVTTNATTEVYLNDNATTAAAFPTKSFTPSGLPAPGTLLSGFQLHLSTVTVMTGAGPHLRVVDPTGSTGIAGTWSGPSGVPGGTGEITLDGWDYWVTEYLNFPTGANSPDVVFTTLGATPGSTEFDIQIRCKAADWDAPVPGTGSNAGQLISQGAFGVYNVARGATGMWLYARYNLSTSGQANTNITCPWGSLGFTDNAWEWLRVTADVANGIRWWVGGPGAWTVVQTDPYPVNWVSWNSATNVRIGNGLLASSALGRGFQGSISDATVSDVVDGAPILNINLVAMTSATDATWPNSGTYGGTWTKGTNVSATGSGLGSGNPTFLFTTPIALDQFAVFLDNTTAGSYRIDEWCLDYIAAAGWSVGFLKF